jgi:hypothetical protein
MRFFIVCILFLPLALFAQDAFDPIRLDPGDDGDTVFYYPAVRPLPNGNLLAQWSSVSPDLIGAYGREVTPTGELLQGISIYDEAEFGVLTYPPVLNNLYFNSGGLARFIFHS